MAKEVINLLDLPIFNALHFQFLALTGFCVEALPTQTYYWLQGSKTTTKEPHASSLAYSNHQHLWHNKSWLQYLLRWRFPESDRRNSVEQQKTCLTPLPNKRLRNHRNSSGLQGVRKGTALLPGRDSNLPQQTGKTSSSRKVKSIGK